MAKKNEQQFRYNLYLKWSRDREIIDWLEAQENACKAIRDRLARTFGERPVDNPGAGALDVETIREAVIRALDDRRLTLGDVRQVVDAALREALGTLAVAGETPDADDATDDWLDNLDGMIIE